MCDRYWAEFRLPVRMTEFDVWTRDEELQADFTRDFLILCFSHPSVTGVQHWVFWETCHWRPSAAMYRADWSEKPNAMVYKDLVLHRWRTNLAGATGPDEFLFGGIGVTITFAAPTPGDPPIGILNCAEGRYVDGQWQHIRWLNGRPDSPGPAHPARTGAFHAPTRETLPLPVSPPESPQVGQ